MQDRLQVIDELDSSRAAEFRTPTSSEVYFCVFLCWETNIN